MPYRLCVGRSHVGPEIALIVLRTGRCCGPDRANLGRKAVIRILSVSRKTDLLLTRNDALALAGFAVVSPKMPREAPRILAERDVDAVVIAQSLAPKERSALMSAIRKLRPAVPLVFVYTSPDNRPEPLADLSVDVGEGPWALIKALQDHLGAAAL